MLLLSIALLILLIFGAFFSAAETALTALSRIDVSTLKAKWKTQGEKIERLLKQPDKLIAALLIGNNISNISASAIVVYITNLYLDDLFIVLGTLMLSLVIIVFCEIAPKQIALIYKRKIAVAVIWPVTFFYILCSPGLGLLLWLIKKMFPMLQKEQAAENLEESLEHMIDLACDNGFIDQYEHDFINNVLDLNDKTAKQIITHRQNVFSVEDSAKIQDIYPKIFEYSYTRIPVYQGKMENIIGILYLNDVQKFCIYHNLEQSNEENGVQRQKFSARLGLDFAGATVAQLMKSVAFLPDSVRVSDLFFYFKQNEGNLVIILDEYGSLAGVVSQEDVLETVFGKLYDEDEKESILVIRKEVNTFVFSGMLNIQQFEEFFGIEIQIEKNTRLATMSGYICDFVGSIPEPGQSIKMPEGIFQIVKSDGKRIVSLRFVPTVAETEVVSK